MGSKSKTRVTIQAQDQTSEIFSIRERVDGDLVLLLKHDGQLERGRTGSYSNVSEQRISIHQSPQSAGITCVFHNVLDRGEYHKGYAFIEPQNDQFLWPIYSRLTCDLSSPQYASESREKDRLISLGSYDPKRSVLAYFVVVTSLGPSHLEAPFDMNGTSIDFTKFRIYVFWAYMVSVSFHQGSFNFSVTALSSVSDRAVESDMRFSEGYKSLNRQQLLDYIQEQCAVFSDEHCFKFSRYVSAVAKEIDPEFAAYSRLFIKEPISSDE